jgi:hypothetical protein
MRKVSRIQGTICLHLLLREASQRTLNCILINIIVIECRLLARLLPISVAARKAGGNVHGFVVWVEANRACQ